MKTLILCAIVSAFLCYAILGISANALAQETLTQFPEAPDRPTPAKPQPPLNQSNKELAGKPGDPVHVSEERVRKIVRDELRKQFNAVRYPALPSVKGGR